MQTTDESLLWISEADNERREARRTKAAQTSQAGEPIELPSKPLDLIVRGNDAWIAENGFVARRLDLVTGKTRTVFRGHKGPVACLALHRANGRLLLFTGSWDKSLRVWDAKTGELLASVEEAHIDFVKALIVLPELNLLVSGGSDRDIRLWDIPDLLSSASKALQSLKSHTRPVERFAAYPFSSSYILHSADSMGKVCVWQIEGGKGTLRCEWRDHETAVYDLVLDVERGQIWTASGDKTALLSSFDPSRPEQPPRPVLRIDHPYFVKAVLPLDDRIATASTDEGIRVWDVDALQSRPKAPTSDSKTLSAVGWKNAPAISAQAEEDDGLLRHVDAHSHEVNRLALWTRVTDRNDLETWVVSASLDGTLRRWRWADLLSPAAPPPVVLAPASSEDNGGMTAEEMAELDALMAE